MYRHFGTIDIFVSMDVLAQRYFSAGEIPSQRHYCTSMFWHCGHSSLGTLGTEMFQYLYIMAQLGIFQPGDISAQGRAIRMFWRRPFSTDASFCSLVRQYSSSQPIKGKLFQKLFETFYIYTFKKENNCPKYCFQKW